MKNVLNVQFQSVYDDFRRAREQILSLSLLNSIKNDVLVQYYDNFFVFFSPHISRLFILFTIRKRQHIRFLTHTQQMTLFSRLLFQADHRRNNRIPIIRTILDAQCSKNFVLLTLRTLHCSLYTVDYTLQCPTGFVCVNQTLAEPYNLNNNNTKSIRLAY